MEKIKTLLHGKISILGYILLMSSYILTSISQKVSIKSPLIA